MLRVRQNLVCAAQIVIAFFGMHCDNEASQVIMQALSNDCSVFKQAFTLEIVGERKNTGAQNKKAV